MALLPEFFTLLGIEIFAAMSLLSALLDRDIPSPAQWLFQAAAAVGLGQLVISQGFMNSGVTNLTRFWISVFYLMLAVCSVVGLNVYFVTVPRKTVLASTFSGTVTVPTIMVTALFVSSFLGSGGEVSFTPVTIAILTVPALVISLSMFGFLREMSKHEHIRDTSGQELSPTDPVSKPLDTSGILMPSDLHSILGEWEESRREKDGMQ